jgi:hypothetical protein
MASKKHTHRYHRLDTSAGQLWACSLPDCNHFMPVHYNATLPGKYSICWGCGNPMILTTENMKDAQPQCPDCTGIADILKAQGQLSFVAPDGSDDDNPHY